MAEGGAAAGSMGAPARLGIALCASPVCPAESQLLPRRRKAVRPANATGPLCSGLQSHFFLLFYSLKEKRRREEGSRHRRQGKQAETAHRVPSHTRRLKIHPNKQISPAGTSGMFAPVHLTLCFPIKHLTITCFFGSKSTFSILRPHLCWSI